MKPTDSLDNNKARKQLTNFLRDECGAVTVDWVVLTAAVVGLAAIAYSAIEGGNRSLSGTVEQMIVEANF